MTKKEAKRYNKLKIFGTPMKSGETKIAIDAIIKGKITVERLLKS